MQIVDLNDLTPLNFLVSILQQRIELLSTFVPLNFLYVSSSG